MRRRTLARECALQMLYETDLTSRPPGECAAGYWPRREREAPHGAGAPAEDEVKAFATKLVESVAGKLGEIDAEIERCAEHWRIDRMALVDRNILRIGVCEILYLADIPSKVAINEAIELAKKFGDSESSKFVNGILDKVAKTHKPCE